MSENGQLFEIADLRYRYAPLAAPALALSCLVLEEGTCTAFIGPNGSGKTTLLKLLNHLLPGQEDPKQCQGEIRFRGNHYSRVLARRHTIYLHQHPYMLPGTVLRNLEVCAPPAAERRALISLLEQVGLAEKKDHQARTLSGGEAQRLALARAIVTGREILILDEPTAHTDAASAIRIWDLLRALKTKKTILFSTHHRKIAETLGDRIVEIADGTIRHDWRNDCAYQSPS